MMRAIISSANSLCISILILFLLGCVEVKDSNTILYVPSNETNLVIKKQIDSTETITPVINSISTQDLLKGKNRIVLNNFVINTQTRQFVLSQQNFNQPNTNYVVKHDYNLMGKSISIPPNCTLVFEGGSFRNGVIIGNETSIIYDGTIFNNISVKGSWVVPQICSTMFGDINTSTNRLKELFALTSPFVNNIVYIDYGNYNLEVVDVAEHLIPLNSNTTVVLNGTITVIGNSFPRYRIFSIFDAYNVIIKGNGKIFGDRDEHKYIPEALDPESRYGINTSHEYGHGVQIVNSSNIEISGITISKCIGDGICIIGKDVLCRDLTIMDCRRQGISIVGGDNISILGCNISNIWGSKKAGFGIDIEPSSGQIASNIIISNCSIISCNGGINTQCHSFESVKSVRVNDCLLSTFSQDNIKDDGHEKYIAVMCFGVRDIEWNNCTIEDSNTMMYVEDVIDFTVRQCRLVSNGAHYGIIFRKNRENVVIDNNQILMYDTESKNPKGVAIANLHNAIVTNNVFLSGNFSFSKDTDCENVIIMDNTINAKWEPGCEIRDSKIEYNTFKHKVVLDNVVESSINNNWMYSLKIKNKKKSTINLNITKK